MKNEGSLPTRWPRPFARAPRCPAAIVTVTRFCHNVAPIRYNFVIMLLSKGTTLATFFQDGAAPVAVPRPRRRRRLPGRRSLLRARRLRRRRRQRGERQAKEGGRRGTVRTHWRLDRKSQSSTCICSYLGTSYLYTYISDVLLRVQCLFCRI